MMMKKALRIVAGSVLALLLLLVGVAAWLTWFFDPNDFKPNIEALLRAHAGLDLRLDGAIEHRVSHHLDLVLHDVKVMDGAEVVAQVERLAFDLALAPLLDGDVVVDSLSLDVTAARIVRDAAGRVNLMRMDGAKAARLDDVTLRAVSVRVSALSLEDAIEQIDLAATDLEFQTSALPLMDNHRVVVGSPSLIEGYQYDGRVRVGELRYADVIVHDLAFAFENREGEIRLSDLALELEQALGGEGDRVVVDGRGSTELRLAYAETWDAGPATALAGVQRLDVDLFDAQVARLLIVRGVEQYTLSDTRVRIETLPLVLDSRPLGEILAVDLNQFLTQTDFRIHAAGATFQAPGLELEDFDITAANEGGVLDLTIERLGAGLEPIEDVQPAAVELTMQGSLRVIPHTAEGPSVGPTVPLETLAIEAADLLVKRLDLDLHGERHGGRDIRLVLTHIPLVEHGRRVSTAEPAEIGARMGQARAQLSVAAAEVAGRTLSDVTVQVAGDGAGIALERFALGLDGTQVSGVGRVALDADPPVWQLDLDAPDLDVGSVLRLTDRHGVAVEGKANVSLALTGRGIAPTDITIAEGEALARRLAMTVKARPYRVRDLRTRIQQLPLLKAGRLMDLRDPRMLGALGGRTTLSVAVQRLEGDELVLDDLSLRAKGARAGLRIEELAMVVEGSRIAGDADVVLGTRVPTWRLRVASDRLALSPLIERFRQPVRVAGEASLRAELEGQGLGALGDTSSALPEQVSVVSGMLQAPTLSVTHEENAYQVKALEIEAKGTPIVAGGRLLDPLDPQNLDAMLAATGVQITAEAVERGGQRVEHLYGGFRIVGDTLMVETFGLEAGGSALKGRFRLQALPSPPAWSLAINAKDLPLGPTFAMLGGDVDAEGRLEVEVQFDGRGLEQEAWLASLTGSAAIDGRDIVFEGADLDAMLSALEATGRAGLLDVGALALGPFGPLLTRGLSLVDAAGSAERRGTTRILRSRIAFDVDAGLVTFKDVAFATPRHRVAVIGGLDLGSGEFRDTKLATLNERGCVRYVEVIRGTLDDPQVRAGSILAKTVVSPITAVLDGAAKLLGPDCTPFYTGAVAPPPKADRPSKPARRFIDRVGRD
jgi:uncharacterized protein involved in outer membrane biogenesis